VLAFAEAMVTDHSAAGSRLATLAMRTMIAPANSPLRSRLNQQAMQTSQALAAILDVATFEATYMETQIAMHVMALQIIDQQLLPVVVNAELRAEVTTERMAVAMHLQHAQALVASADGGAPDGGDAADASTP
jgi:putative membrane protein